MDALVDHLKAFGEVRTAAVENVLRSVDRVRYTPATAYPYEDAPQCIGDGQTISAPHMHAICLELLAPVIARAIADSGHCDILDVGSGSAYLCVALALLAGEHATVTGIDRLQSLVDWGRGNVAGDRPELLTSGRIRIVLGDGWMGVPGAKFDAIHVGASAEKIPDALVEQLKPGGRMMIPVGGQWENQNLCIVDKSKDGHTVDVREVMGVRYVPLVKPH